jgi:hypothetical protein
MPVGTSLSSVKFLRQLSPSPFNDFQASLELPGFLVNVGQLFLELLLVQVILPTRLLDKGFDFVPQQPKPRVAVHVAFPKLQFSRSDGSNDLRLSQAKLLPSRLVAESSSLL